ncbi:DNA polymerase I [Microcoleus sp. BR0-C5]|uniref:DNA polymerase I n=1 Tax=Microcoleus sp. BR0-C5 TaxID=2818713 RepID=UPI002FD5B8BE
MRSVTVSVSANQAPIFILVDGHSLAFRSYFAFAKSRDGGLRTTTGIPTSVCFGFLKSLLEVMAAHDPQYMAIAFDLATPTFRHEADETYKAGRAETPEDFIPDIKNLQELLTYLNLPAITAPGFEADDVLGTLANKASAAGYQVKILTGDRDLFQLVETEKQISVLYLSTDELRRSGKGKSQEYGPEEVKAKLGILPEQVIDYKALCGDKSDNIPGVKGIGDKTALQLLEAYNSLDGIYAAIDEIKGATKKKLEEGKEAAYHSQRMATIVQDVPLEINLEDCQLIGFDESALIPMLEKLEFKTFLSKVKQIQKRFGGTEEQLTNSGTGILPVAKGGQDAQPLLPTINSTDSGTGILPVAKGGQDAHPTIDKSPATSESSEDESDTFYSLAETLAAQQENKLPIKPRIIQTTEQLNELVKLLQTYTDKTSPVAWDTETTALEPRDAELVGIGCCWGTGEEDLAYIPTGHKTGKNLDKATVLNALRPILESENYPKALQNAKFDRSILRCQGIKLAGVVFDTMLASYVLNPENSHSLSELSKKYLVESEDNHSVSESLREYLRKNPKSYNKLVSKNQTIADSSIREVADYCGMDVYTTFHLVGALKAKLKEADESSFPDKSLHKLLLEVEQPLEPVLAEMEYQGVRIDTGYLKELSNEMEPRLAAIEQEIYNAIPLEDFKAYLAEKIEHIEPTLGTVPQKVYETVPSAILKPYLKKILPKNNLNLAEIKQKVDNTAASELLKLNSPSQLSELLFDILKLNTKKSSKTATGFYSTNAGFLENLQGDHKVVDAILDYRTLQKLYSTYVDAIPKRVRPDTQRLHTDFNQTVTDTGRLSSSNPNLQNIPIGTEFSKQIRKAFLPEEGWLMVSADYSQIELRILAHLSQEPVLIEAYQNNRDVHTVTAQLLFEKEEITPDERRFGKTINFGVVYGMGAIKFGRSMGKTSKDGKEFIAKFNARYSKVFEYLEKVKKEAIALGYVTTILGRRRYLKFESESLRDLKGRNPQDIHSDRLKSLSRDDAQSLRAAANAPIQGSSADIIKLAMIEVHKILQNYQARLLLQVHDELIFEVPPDEWEELQPKIRTAMENALPLSVPLIVDIHAGQNWMETK